jgi:hypothetical protein
VIYDWLRRVPRANLCGTPGERQFFDVLSNSLKTKLLAMGSLLGNEIRRVSSFVGGGEDPLWFAIMLCVNLQIGFMAPPFAGGIFIAKGLAPPEVTTADIIRGVLPFIGLVVVNLGILAAFPKLITWLPNRMIR